MKEGWEYRKIGDIMSVERGGSPRPIKKYLTDSPEGLNWIKIGDASSSNKYIYETKEKITKDGLKKSRFVKEGDFLLSNSMSFGRPYIMKTNGCIHDGWLVLKNKEVVELDKDFLYHLLCSPNIFKQFDKLAAGSTVRNLNIGLVSSVKIPIPPLSEQKQIVVILDEAFTAIDKAKANIEKNIENAGELFQSRLNSYDFKNEKLENLVDIKTGKLNANAAVKGGKYPFFTCSREVYQIDKYAYDCEAILLAGNNAVGDFNVKHYKGKFEAYQRTYIITAKNESKLNYRFLYFQMVNSLQGLKSQSVGVGTKFLKLPLIKAFKIAYPNINEQIQFVEEIDSLLSFTEDLVTSYQQKLIALEQLKKSLLQKAFDGELT